MALIRVLLADDHPYLRAGIRAHLATLPDLVVVGEAADGVEGLRLARELLPDVLVLDVELPGLSGVEVARRLRAAGSPVRVLALSAHDDARYVQALLQSGAAGYLLKDDAAIDLTAAIRGVAGGEQGWCSRRVVERLAQRHLPSHLPLSMREQQVLRLAAHRRSNDRIALQLGIAPKTVENHVSSILTKLGLHSRGDAVAWAWGQGLVGPADALPGPPARRVTPAGPPAH